MTLRVGPHALTSRAVHVHLAPGAGLRPLVVADVLRRVAERRRHRVRLTAAARLPADPSDYNVRAPESLAPDTADVLISPAPAPGALLVPNETGAPGPDPLATRLAFLEAPYRVPVALTPETLRSAAARLARYRRLVADWAISPGRPMHRPSAAEAESALAADLDTPGALAVLDRLAESGDVPPGAKLETFVHVDLLLGLDVVAAIGTA
ncbi:hypothetical protein [Actinomadura kijaniata]|uniref:hypothetical protein n=1 Tax=Actinomadura kijaniata TaxID=46161 RepID=UPI0008323882|nr:hypothetical protein [Actinomadura kijaniata]